MSTYPCFAGQTRCRRRASVRRGAATVELTVTIPLLILVVLGGIEASNAIYMQQTVTEASYQGALLGMQPWSTESGVANSVVQLLDARGISCGQVTIAGPDGTPFDDLLPGDPFNVTVDVPAQENSLAATFSGRFDSFGAVSHARRQ